MSPAKLAAVTRSAEQAPHRGPGRPRSPEMEGFREAALAYANAETDEDFARADARVRAAAYRLAARALERLAARSSRSSSLGYGNARGSR